MGRFRKVAFLFCAKVGALWYAGLVFSAFWTKSRQESHQFWQRTEIMCLTGKHILHVTTHFFLVRREWFKPKTDDKKVCALVLAVGE
jgi:hypothetical protein